MAAGAGGYGRFEVSHADREQVVDVLKNAFRLGHLDRVKFDLRVSEARVARTHADLAAVTADLPARLDGAWPLEPARESVSRKTVLTMTFATTTLIGLWPVMMMTPPWPRWVLPVALIWFILAAAVPMGWLALLHDWLTKRRQAVQT